MEITDSLFRFVFLPGLDGLFPQGTGNFCGVEKPGVGDPVDLAARKETVTGKPAESGGKWFGFTIYQVAVPATLQKLFAKLVCSLSAKKPFTEQEKDLRKIFFLQLRK